MSFILDALKKSETERQKQNSPGIANIPEGSQQRSGSKWIWIIVALLAVNLAVLGGMMMRSNNDPEPVAGQTPALATDSEATAEVFSGIETGAKPATPAVAVREEEIPPAAALEKESATPQAAAVPRQSVSEGLPSFNELRAKGVLQLPDMHVDIHVYSGTPANRFVFINMSKYAENSTLSEGPLVREITPDGVVLDYLGTAFLLPRE
jgi:general secretion pathway protein B